MKRLFEGQGARYWIVGFASLLVLVLVVGACDMAERGPTGIDTEVDGLASGPAGRGEGSKGQDASGGGDFYPLEIGNQWTYSSEICLVRKLFGSGLIDSFVVLAEECHELVGTEVLSGQEYILERQERRQIGSGDVYTQWTRYRQDRAGLYEADVPVTRPPVAQEGLEVELAKASAGPWASLRRDALDAVETEHKTAFDLAWAELGRKLEAIERFRGLWRSQQSADAGPPGGVKTGEITRLAYPLHPGKEWTVRGDPFFGSEVESRDVLILPPGRMSCFRVKMVSDFYGPNDEVLLWYGRDGYLGLTFHVEGEAIDAGGNVIGVLIGEREDRLESIDLVGSGRF